jgi:hypothetical protein
LPCGCWRERGPAILTERGLADRVEALGGGLTVTDGAARTVVSVELAV